MRIALTEMAILPKISDISFLPDLFVPGEPVSITEQISAISFAFLNEQGAEAFFGDLTIGEQIGDDLGIFAKLSALGSGTIMLFGGAVQARDGTYRFYASDLLDGESFADPLTFRILMEEEHIPVVPLLYEGPFDMEIVEQCTSGASLVSANPREGCVIRSLTGRTDPRIGRVIASCINPEIRRRDD